MLYIPTYTNNDALVSLRSEATGVEEHQLMGPHRRRTESQVLQTAQQGLVRLLDLVETVPVQHGQLAVCGGDDCSAVHSPTEQSQFAYKIWCADKLVGGEVGEGG